MVPPDVKQGIDRIDYWPPYSPELNMIEPCWKHLKKEIPSLEIPHSAAQANKISAINALDRLINGDEYFEFA